MNLLRPPEPSDGLPGCDEYAALPCTRADIEDYFRRRDEAMGLTPCRRNVPPDRGGSPEEWFADKNNRLAGRPTGNIRMLNVGRSIRAEWVAI